MKNFLLATLIVVIAAGSVTAENWWESIKVNGDLRYRQEMVDVQDKAERYRHRLRVRLNIHGTVSEYTTVGFQLATGSGSPVSTNVTLDDASSLKDIRLSLAYMESRYHKLPGLTLIAGKLKNPFFKPGKSQLIWDSDWNPEGGVLKFHKEYDQLAMTLTGAGLWIDESSSGDDSYLMAAQTVVRYNVFEKMSVTFGGAYFNYANTQDHIPFYDGRSMGNTIYADTVFDGTEVDEINNRYACDFDLIEGFVEITHKFDAFPATIMADFVKNSKADSLDTGWLVGIHLGKAKKPGSWSVSYIYRDIQADAAVGTFTHSDFRGGGTDGRGHEMGASVILAKNTAVAVSYYMDEAGIASDTTTDLKRFQVDLKLKF